ncbi:Superoxide dismutase [Cu-Zn] [Halocaridina rubra]|uniref:Superoxide dismutase [Cu-Zn] n=1 Tax=Halocaridina rubra TaxID=373956 RepID=A0AAN8XLI3_HALRR
MTHEFFSHLTEFHGHMDHQSTGQTAHGHEHGHGHAHGHHQGHQEGDDHHGENGEPAELAGASKRGASHISPYSRLALAKSSCSSHFEKDGQQHHENEDIHDAHGLHSTEDDHEYGHEHSSQQHSHGHDHGHSHEQVHSHEPGHSHEHVHIHENGHGHDHSHDHVHIHEIGHGHDHSHDHVHIHENGHGHDHSHDHEHSHENGHGHDHSHDHVHSHENGHGHDHSHDHVHSHENGHGHDHSHDHEHSHENGHGHDHSHDHVHSHENGHGHDHSHDHVHNHENGHGHGHSHEHGHDHGHGHSHSEENEDESAEVVLKPRPGLALIPGREAQGGMPPSDPWMYATCDLQPNADTPDSSVSGNIVISQRKDKKGPVYFDLHLAGVDVATLGKIHGFHVHENSVTGGSCASTGGHFNPEEVVHGGPKDEVRHVGDLGNIEVDENGELHGYIISDRIVAFTGKHSIIGKALVLHSGVDDLGTGGDEGSRTTGNAGGRLACCTVHMKAVPLFRFKG